MAASGSKRWRTDGDEEVRKKPCTIASTFLGTPLNKYDIDEITPEATVSGGGALDRLTSLSLAIPEAQKSLQLKNQVARDKHGRRAFHGAFTGGFSAGYHNAVGSAEGWTPGSFQSSQKQRASNRQQRVEDFMDEHDVEDMVSGQHPSMSIVPREPPQPTLITEDLGDDTNHPFAAAASEFLVQTSHSVGHRILRSMGWREGARGVMVSLLSRSKPSEAQSHSQNSRRRLGPERPPTLPLEVSPTVVVVAEQDPQPGGYDAEWWSERRRVLFDNFLAASLSMRRQFKRDNCGLGYQGPALPSAVTRVKDKTSSEIGVGVLENDDDDWDVYGDNQVVLSASARTMDELVREDREPLVFVDGDSEKYLDPIEASPFLRFHVISVCSPVPQTFQGRYIVTAVERDHENAVRQGSVGGVIAALVRHLQQHQPAMFTSSTTPKAPTPEARTVAKAALTKTPADAAKPLWSRITDETRFALAGSLLSKSRFVQSSETHQHSPQDANLRYPMDSEKQRRYALFCLALEERVPPSVMLESQALLSPEAAAAERVEFGEHYRAFRKSYPHIPLRDVAATADTDNSSNAGESHARVCYNWQPNRLLCTRFKLPDPWAKKAFVDDRPSQLKKTSSAVKMREKSGKLVSPSATFVNNLAQLLHTDTQAVPEAEKRGHEPKLSQPTATLEDVQACIDRPPLSIFKCVFGDGED